ncbi:hypothetical protein [Streptomyces hilarionis]|uniref:hypothetical protein n=1 Tax=Streptomyces hilarionis TaxID=2839954 RepID=UPI002119CFC4|nr:hypothetical protein [Streptomyces hilarionis]MCQ9135178.1 hypothetical protein [Streptomyces hilarionis]
MGSSQGRRAALQERANELGHTRGRRTYAITGVAGGLSQLAWRTAVVVLTLALGMIVFARPESALLKGAVVGGLLLALVVLRLVWRRFSADRGMNRCHLYGGGLAVTDQSGRLRDVAAWSEATELKWSVGAVLFTPLYRVELARRAAEPLAFVVPAHQTDLITALQEQATRHGIPQKQVRYIVS